MPIGSTPRYCVQISASFSSCQVRGATNSSCKYGRAESGAGALQEHVDTVHNGLRQLCESLLRSLADAGVLKEGLDLRREVEVLHALLDGLALHAAIQPDRTTPTRLRQLMRRQLESLMARNP